MGSCHRLRESSRQGLVGGVDARPAGEQVIRGTALAAGRRGRVPRRRPEFTRTGRVPQCRSPPVAFAPRPSRRHPIGPTDGELHGRREGLARGGLRGPVRVAFIDQLQKTASKAVGFMPAAQLAGKVNAGHVLVAESVAGGQLPVASGDQGGGGPASLATGNRQLATHSCAGAVRPVARRGQRRAVRRRAGRQVRRRPPAPAPGPVPGRCRPGAAAGRVSAATAPLPLLLGIGANARFALRGQATPQASPASAALAPRSPPRRYASGRRGRCRRTRTRSSAAPPR